MASSNSRRHFAVPLVYVATRLGFTTAATATATATAAAVMMTRTVMVMVLVLIRLMAAAAAAMIALVPFAAEIGLCLVWHEVVPLWQQPM